MVSTEISEVCVVTVVQIFSVDIVWFMLSPLLINQPFDKLLVFLRNSRVNIEFMTYGILKEVVRLEFYECSVEVEFHLKWSSRCRT
jgi:hypothetical protein